MSKNVKRGLKSKLDKGWMPGTAPLGYLNTKTEIRGENYIIVDPERFPLIRRAWDLMLTGNYIASEIVDKLNNEWGFRTRGWKKRGGKPMSRSTIYRTFTNAFYAGVIPYKGLFIEGKHQAMITLEEFDRVQHLLGRDGRHRPQRYQYAYTGKIICGECGGLVSATFKEKILKQTGMLKKYVLYYCICAIKNSIKCSKKEYVNSEKIDVCIEAKIDSLAIMAEFKDWALQVVSELNTEEITERTKIYESQQKAVNDVQKQINNLTQLRLKELVEEDEYTRERTRLKNELTAMRAKIKTTEERADSWIDLTEQSFKFAYYAHKAFLFGDSETKREILSTVSRLNCTLKGEMLLIQATEWFEPIEKSYPALKAKIDAFEPTKILTVEGRKEIYDSISPEMRGLVDAVGTKVQKYFSSCV